MTPDQKKVALTKYADHLRQRLASPDRLKNPSLKSWLELDLKRMLRKIEKL